MPLTEKQLRQDLKKELRRIYLLYGEESYLTAQYTDNIARQAVPEDIGGFNLQFFDGETADFQQIAEAVEALPLMAEQKCVVIREPDISTADRAQKLTALLTEPPKTTVIILSYIHTQPQQKSAAWKKLTDTVQAHGAVICFDKKTAAEAAHILCSGAVRRGCTLSLQNAALLVEQCGNDMLLLSHELDKLAALADGGEITADMIDKTAVKNLEARVFDLSKVILQHRQDAAYTMLQTLLRQGEEPIVILAVLTNTYVDIYRMKIVAGASQTAAEVTKAFPLYKGKEFRLRYAAKDAAALSVPKLREALDILAQADMRLKSSRTDPRILLEETLARLL